MFLEHLIRRALGEASGIAPRRLSRFEPDTADRQPPMTESFEAAPARAHTASPPAQAPQVPLDAPGRMQTFVVERAAERHETAASPTRSAAIAIDRLAEPAPPRLVPPLEARPAPVAPRRDPAPAVAHESARPVSDAKPTIEHHSQTIIRETAETRLEGRIIERRLESLVRQIEHPKEFRSTGPTPVETRSTAAPVQSTRARTVVVAAQTSRSATPRPTGLEAHAAAPVAPTVHVSIGRVEVRAAAPAAAPPKSHRSAPRLNLEDYLLRRERA